MKERENRNYEGKEEKPRLKPISASVIMKNTIQDISF